LGSIIDSRRKKLLLKIEGTLVFRLSRREKSRMRSTSRVKRVSAKREEGTTNYRNLIKSLNTKRKSPLSLFAPEGKRVTDVRNVRKGTKKKKEWINREEYRRIRQTNYLKEKKRIGWIKAREGSRNGTQKGVIVPLKRTREATFSRGQSTGKEKGTLQTMQKTDLKAISRAGY